MKERIREIPCWLIAFGVNLAIALVAFLPFVLKDNGYFAMSFDYSARAIPFQMFLNDAVKSGNFLWNWNIELGGNLLESFSSQCLGSVFFLLSLVFPTELVPKAMVWIHILKYAVAGATSAGFIKRHVKNRGIVILASMLYAFSGFQTTSVVYYYYQDVVALFPLLLIGLERLVEEKKRSGLLAACVLNAFCNYKFFIGELVFVALYYVMKYLIPDIKANKKAKEYLAPVRLVVLEEVLGMAMGGVLLIPALCGLLQKERVIHHLYAGGWLSTSSGEIMEMLKAILFPAENMHAMSNLVEFDWRVNTVYLPVVGAIFVFAYVMNRKDWLADLLKVLAVCAAVPILNGFFTLIMENVPRYWFYMPILIMVLATAKVIENPKAYSLKKPMIFWSLLMAFYLVMVGFVKWSVEDAAVIYSMKRFLFYLALSVGGIVASVLVVKLWEKRRVLLLNGMVGIVAVGTMALTIYLYQHGYDNADIDFHEMPGSYAENIVDYYSETFEGLEEDILPYRYNIDEGIGYSYMNLSMANSMTSVNAFFEDVHPSIIEFYDCIGIERENGTPGITREVASLLGVKYVVSSTEGLPFPLVQTLSNSNGQVQYVYENEMALPIGFTYNAYITRSELEEIEETMRPYVMLKALVIMDEDEALVKECLAHYDYLSDTTLSTSDGAALAQERKAESSSEFTAGENTFGAVIIADAEKYAFFSVPYDAHWKAVVNGEETEVLNINGLMAVKVIAGENQVVFEYQYTPIIAGSVCTVIGMIATVVYLMNSRRKGRQA